MYIGGHPKKPKILLLVPTGVAAVDINRTKFNYVLQVCIEGKMFSLNDSQRVVLKNTSSQVKIIIIIDEILMASSMVLYQINQRSNEIFGYSDQLPFVEISAIVCGGFY